MLGLDKAHSGAVLFLFSVVLSLCLSTQSTLLYLTFLSLSLYHLQWGKVKFIASNQFCVTFTP